MASPMKAAGAGDNALPAEKLGKAANKAVHDIRYAVNDVAHDVKRELILLKGYMS